MTENTISNQTSNTGIAPDSSLDLSWSQIRSILKDGAEQTKTAMNLAMTNKGELADPLVTCTICLQPYHSSNAEGQIEKPALAACGHIFGDECIERWLACPIKNAGPTCPVCRFPLKFPTCLHAIAAVDPYDIEKPPPPALMSDRSDVPVRCSECALHFQPSHQKYHALEGQKKIYAKAIENLQIVIATSKATSLEDILKNALQQKDIYEAELQNIERNMSIEKEKLAEEKVNFIESFQGKNVWHLRVDTTKWRIPGESYEDDSARVGEEDDEDDEEYDDYDDEQDHDDEDGDSMGDIDEESGRMLEGLSEGDDEDVESVEPDQPINLDETMNLNLADEA